MDKETLSKYGWVVIIIIIIVILLGFATPFGNFMADSTMNILKSLSRTANLVPGTGNNQVVELVTNYSAAEVDANEHLYPIGKTDPYYVVATFNEDYTVMDITMNGPNSDGLMKDWIVVPEGAMLDENSSTSEFVTKYGNTLTTINIYNGIKNIGAGFMQNSNFLIDYISSVPQAIMLDSSPAQFMNLEKFQTYTNYQGTALTTLNILSESLTVIDDCSFTGCTNLNNISWGQSVECIGTSAFWYCGLENVVLPESLKTTELLSFACTNLQSFSFKNIETIGAMSFVNCIQAKGNIVLPDSCKNIQNGAFAYCLSLDGTLTLNEGLETIEASAFLMCYNMSNKALIIPSTVSHINSDDSWIYAFHNMSDCAFGYFATNTLEKFIVADGNSNFVVDENGILKKGLLNSTDVAAPISVLLQLIEENGRLGEPGDSSGTNGYKIVDGLVYKTSTQYGPRNDLVYIPFDYTGSVIFDSSLTDIYTDVSFAIYACNLSSIIYNTDILVPEGCLSYFAMFNDNSDDIVLNTTKITRDGDNFTVVS